MLPPLEQFLDGTIKTLGFGVLEWCSKYLVNPDGDLKGERWIFQDDQAHFVLAFYAVDDKGEWVYRRAYRERAKGTGKSPMVAAIACAELLGPVVFSHFDPHTGQAVGKARKDSLVWLAAVSLEGSDHTYRYVMSMLEGEAEQVYNLDIGMTRILVRGSRGTKFLKQVTASPKSLEGPKPTFVICEETQNWTPAEQGPQLMATIHRGLTKTDGRRIEVTNAPIPGAGTVAEATHKYQEEIELGEREAEGLLFDTYSIHVPDIYDKEQAMPALRKMYANAPWQNLNRIWRDINDPSHSEIDSRRFFFNEIRPPEAMWITEEEWDGAERPLRLNVKDPIALGFRIRKHACAIVATRLTDQAIFLLRLWERPEGENTPRDWEVPYGDIDKRMRHFIERFNVRYVMTSPNGFADVIGRWAIEYSIDDERTFEAIWLDRNKQKHADAVEVFESAIRSKRLKHDGNPDLKRHIMRTFTTEVPQGKLIRMETIHSTKYIVAAEAALLSFQGAIEAITDGALEEPEDNELFSFS